MKHELERLMMRYVRDQAGVPYGGGRSARIVVEPGGAMPHVAEVPSSRGTTVRVVRVGNDWLVRTMERTVREALAGMGCDLGAPVEVLALNLRTENALKAGNVRSLEALCGRSATELLELPGVGKGMVEEVGRALAAQGRSLRTS